MGETEKLAGQPFTFSGVARYAGARFGRVLGMALAFALLPAAIVGGIAGHGWWPVVTEAISALPETGRIEGGELQVKDREARLLAANQFLSVQFSPGDVPAENSPVDFIFEFGRYELMIGSLLGQMAIPYPATWIISLDRSAYIPVWGAWKGPLLLGLAGLALVGLIVTWLVLALLYAPVALFIGGLAGRDVNFAGAWRMCVAGQWPASLLMSFALGLYATGEIGLLFVIIMFVAHFIPSLLNVLIAPLFLPRAEKVEKSARKKNPFGNGKPKKRSKKNPFESGGTDED